MNNFTIVSLIAIIVGLISSYVLDITDYFMIALLIVSSFLVELALMYLWCGILAKTKGFLT